MAFLSGSVAIGVFTAFNNYTLSSWLFGLTSSFFIISIFGNSKSLEGAILSPIFGHLSDRTWLGWLGRRRPYILSGALLSGPLLALTPQIARALQAWTAGYLPAGVTVLGPALLAIFLFTLTFNLVDDQYRALLPDLFAGDDRDRMSSLMVVAEFTAQVFIMFLFAGTLRGSDAVPDWTFALAGAVLTAAALVVVLGIEEPSPERWAAGRGRHAAATGAGAASPWAAIGRYPGAVPLLCAVFAYWAGVNAVLPLVTVYVEVILGATKGEAQLLPALLVLSTLVAAIPMGFLGTKLGRRRVIGAGYLIMALAAVAGMVITTKAQGAALFLFAGVGNAAVIVLTLPLLSDLVPRVHIGAAVGLMSAASSVAAPLSSVAGGALSDRFGPRAIFSIMLVMIALAAVFLARVQPPVTSRDVEAPHVQPSL